ncbi:sodium/glutamate symporter [Aliagarivorans marinus]|uniref:sodium/glutamate symporter n=1 Tax=Aliagarivorans marinus TaxID=561965 RepID=UPI0004052B9B|nr:sodium/glutamate symporter [Aliagarivorans marinus]
MTELQLDGFISFTLAMALLFVGKAATNRFSLLRQYSIPEPVIGGFACALLVAAIYYFGGVELSFDLVQRDYLLLYFFAGIGLKADLKSLVSGGKPLLVLTLLAVVYIVLQNGVGIWVASLFGLEPIIGLLAGSISLIGGVGTTMAWAPIFEAQGIANAAEIGVASNTLGLIAACLIGGPIAKYLLSRHKLSPSENSTLDIGVQHNEQAQLNHYGYLYAWLLLNLSMILGYMLDLGLTQLGLNLPMFVACLIAGIIISNVKTLVLKRPMSDNANMDLGLISDICLGMFLTMALMGLQLWTLINAIGFLSIVMLLQITLSLVFTVFVVFRFMGRDYDAAVISSGFGGITLGSTATAIVNMTAVTQQYGASHRAFIVVPLVCGFFIDIANAVVINSMLSFVG